jgi:hypothetical protein
MNRRLHRPALVSLAAALALAALACDAGPTRPPTVLLTLGGMRAAYQTAPARPLGAGLSDIFKGGFPPSYFLASPDDIRIAPAFTEGEASAYMSTDVWINFPKVWVQPLYIFVSGFTASGAPMPLDLPWVMGVGPQSAFWSPYFRVTFVEVDPRTPADRFRRVGDILSANLRLFPGPTRLVTAAPAGMHPEAPEKILLPELQGEGGIGLPVMRTVWIDGVTEAQSALDFGPGRFEIGPGATVVEQPLFFFFKQEAGTWVSLTAAPRVGGTGELFANRTVSAPGNRPAFGSFWRLWSVRLPGSARIFVPSAQVATWEARTANWSSPSIALARLPAALDRPEMAAALAPFAYKILLDDACLATAANVGDLAACPFLDSQAALEKYLPTALWPSEVLVTCPFVAYDGKAVPPPPQ